VAVLFAGAMLIALSPAPSEAQLKKLGKAIGGLVDKPIDKAAGTDSSNTASASRGATATSSATVEITGERLDQFFAAIKPQMDEAKVRIDLIARKKEFEERRKAFEERQKAFEMCKVQVMQDPSQFQGMEDSDPAVIKLNKRLEVANAALGKELAKGAAMDQKKVAEINVELQDIIAAQQLLSYPGIKKCGPRPVPPPEPPEPPAPSSSGAKLAPSARANFTRSEFGLLRERIGAWVLTQGKPDKRMTFSASEQAVMQSRARDLAVLEPYFRDGSIAWAYWGDLPSDWQ
jgi:hypothetical protein